MIDDVQLDACIRTLFALKVPESYCIAIQAPETLNPTLNPKPSANFVVVRVQPRARPGFCGHRAPGILVGPETAVLWGDI